MPARNWSSCKYVMPTTLSTIRLVRRCRWVTLGALSSGRSCAKSGREDAALRGVHSSLLCVSAEDRGSHLGSRCRPLYGNCTRVASWQTRSLAHFNHSELSFTTWRLGRGRIVSAYRHPHNLSNFGYQGSSRLSFRFDT